MAFSVVAALVLLRANSVLSGGPGAESPTCLLQVAASKVESQAAPVDPTTCSLPANGRWCQVRLGSADFSMAVYNSADIVSNEICNTGTWELQAADVTAIGKPGVALDIGANVGFYSFVLAAHGWKVTSFEPMSANHELIDATMCANPNLKKMITMNKFGLGAKDDHCIIISGDDNLGDGVSQCGDDAKKPIQAGYHQRATMDIRRLDDVLTEEHVASVDFVKMDVEGFECQVMAGGQSLLTKYRPKLIQSEVWPAMQGCQPQDYLAAFAKASYSVTKDRGCTHPDLSKPEQIDNRYMCREAEKTGTSLLEVVANLKPTERKILWLVPDEHVQSQ